MLETQPLSEPLEPLPDMQCDDSELSVAGEREEGHSDDHEFGLHDLYLILDNVSVCKGTGHTSPQIGHTPVWALLKL